MSARSRRLRSSLESSWGDAEYSSDENASIKSASDLASEVELEESDEEVIKEQDTATPLPPRKDQRISPVPQAPMNGNSSRTPPSRTRLGGARHSPTTGSGKSTLRRGTHKEEHSVPSFIMPSMNNSPNEYMNGSPMRKSQFRQRNVHRSSNGLPRVPSYTQRGSKDEVSPSQPQEEAETSPWHYVNLFSEHLVLPLVTYLLNVFSYSMRHIVKPFLGVALGILILLGSVQMATGVLRSTISNALLSPICLIPGSSYIIPYCDSTPIQQANFEELINVQSRFEDILDASKDTSTLPSTIKNSELAIRDLRTLVRYSKLPSRHELDNEFHYFVLTAKEASEDLSRYNSRIGAAMDRVIATNTWTMAVLHGIEEKEASNGALSRVLHAVSGAFVAPPPTLQQRVFDQYILHVSKNKEEITGLIETAQALLQVLNNLDDRLGTIHDMATNDDHTITKNQEELLSSLWTKLGGNRKDVKSNDKQLLLLKNIGAYRKKALMHVSETLLKLQEIQAELENLRESVAAPEVLGHRDEVPLSFHINVIEAAVERLRVSRGESMRVEGENYRRMVRSGENGGDVFRELPGPTVTVRAS